jgi:hypothetical protein
VVLKEREYFHELGFGFLASFDSTHGVGKERTLELGGLVAKDGGVVLVRVQIMLHKEPTDQKCGRKEEQEDCKALEVVTSHEVCHLLVAGSAFRALQAQSILKLAGRRVHL